jgi:hypothetical protein
MNANDLERRITEISSASYKMGIKHERERIIALLESKDEWHYEFSDVSDVIALIRGE